MRKALLNFFSKINPSGIAWRGASFGLLLITLLLWVFSTWDLLENNTPFSEILLYFFAGIIFFALVGVFILFFVFVFEKIPLLYKWALACFISVTCYFFIPQFTTYGIMLIALWCLMGFSLIGAAISTLIFSKEKLKKPLSSIFYLLPGLIILSLLGVWFLINQSAFKPPSIPQSRFQPSTINLPSPALPGDYAFKTLSYGSGKDLHRPEYGKEAKLITPNVDGSNFINEWDGIRGWLRSHYWGFDSSQLPLNGRVWYPEGQGPFPLVLIVHGNHEMTAPSDTGYEYLGTLLASRGFVTISIDENFLNGSWHGELNESPARGWLILEHLKLWRSWSEDKKNLFYQKVDMRRIALIGHSRGGEAVAAAAALNPLSHYPGNGNIHMDYGFDIRSLVAIAPVDAQFKPGGVKIGLNNIDYLVIQGSHDGDVRSFEGSAQFHRINFTGSEYHFKAALYILGANHGQFNSVWGAKDTSAPANALFDLGKIMPAEQQQQIAKVYVSAFLDATLNNKMDYLPLFQNYRAGENWLPKTLYLNEFADSTYKYIDNDYKDIDITKTSLAGGIEKGENLKVWRQGQVNLKDGEPIHIGTFLGWDTTTAYQDPPSFTVNLPEQGLMLSSDSVLVLDLANGNDADNNPHEKEEGVDDNMDPIIGTPFPSIDFSIEITDRQGASATLSLSDYSYLPPPIDINLMKAALLDPTPDSEYVFQTFEFPLTEFARKNSAMNHADLKSIRLIFDKTSEGLIIIDSIAFRNNQIKK